MLIAIRLIFRSALLLALAFAASAQAMCVRNMADLASLSIQLDTGKRELPMNLQAQSSFCTADHNMLSPDQAKQPLVLYVSVSKPAGSLGCQAKKGAACVVACVNSAGNALQVPAGALLSMDIYQRDSETSRVGQPFLEINPNNGRDATTRVRCS